MIQTASNEYGRIDDADVRASELPLPDTKRQTTARTVIPSPARLYSQPSDIPATSPATRHSSNPPSLSPLELAVHVRGSHFDRSPWERTLAGGHGIIGNGSTTLLSQAEDSTSERHNPRHQAISHDSHDPEKGSCEPPRSQPSYHTSPQPPFSKIEYIYSDISSEDSNTESHALWILVSPPPPTTKNSH